MVSVDGELGVWSPALCSGCTKDCGDVHQLVKTFNDFLDPKVYFLMYFNLGKCLASNADAAPL
jgi:hypothetical protein